MTLRSAMLSLVFLTVPATVAAQVNPQKRDCVAILRLPAWTLQNREYFDPLYADPRAANVKVVFPANADPFRFGAEAGGLGRRVWDISLGKEIPLYGCERRSARRAPLQPGDWGVGLWLPISFHMIEDLADSSAPIINTDYRFAGMLKAQRAFTGQRFVGFRLVGGHESTHLGDEFSLAARRRSPDFERINVSYEYWDIAGSFEQRMASGRAQVMAGMVRLLRPARGYYSGELTETNGRVVVRSRNAAEPWLGAQWVGSRPFGPAVLDVSPFVSIDLRNKTQYDFRKTDARAREPRQWSINAMVGLKRPEKFYLERGVPSIFFQFYNGVNPHGQFREQRNWTMVGLGLHVPL